MDEYPPRCIHAKEGEQLCEACEEAFEEDPGAYLEYGDHPEGLRRWQELQTELDYEAIAWLEHTLRNPCPESDIPF